MNFLDLIFPPKCPFCGTLLNRDIPLCANCEKELLYTEGKQCEICSLPLPPDSYRLCCSCRMEKRHFVTSFIPLVCSGKAQHTVISLKYYSHPYYANALAYLIADKLLKGLSPSVKLDFITYVPQSRKTFHNRGYNQSELIAKRLSKILKIPCKSTLLRTDDGERQATLNAAQRKENVKKCYFSKVSGLIGTALLVDDVYTTGATANYCSYLLKKSGCSKVYVAAAMIRA